MNRRVQIGTIGDANHQSFPVFSSIALNGLELGCSKFPIFSGSCKSCFRRKSLNTDRFSVYHAHDLLHHAEQGGLDVPEILGLIRIVQAILKEKVLKTNPLLWFRAPPRPATSNIMASANRKKAARVAPPDCSDCTLPSMASISLSNSEFA